MTIPKNFPVGNIRLSQHLNRAVRGNPLSRQVPLIAPFSGPAPRWDGRAPIRNIHKAIQAREGGTLRQFVTARTHPTELKTQQPPHLSTQSLPPEVMSDPKVEGGSGTVRDAEPAKAASL